MFRKAVEEIVGQAPRLPRADAWSGRIAGLEANRWPRPSTWQAERLPYNRQTPPLTRSCGVSSFPGHGDHL